MVYIYFKRMKFRLTIILVFLGFQLSFGQTSLEQINLKKGKYAVGFTHYLTSDSTRTYQRIFDWNNDFISRPIRVSVWFPAANAGNKMTMSVLEYMQILKQEEEWEHLPDNQLLNWFYYANSPANQLHLNEKTSAVRGVKPAKGPFPVVIYAPSYQASSIENFALCEYLASQGYIVIASPSRGTETRFLEGGTQKDMETQATDIDFLVTEVSKIPAADLNRMATMGFSFGGLSNVLAQIRNRKIKAIVSLDGSVKYNFNTLKQAALVNMEKVDVPFIHFAQKDIPEQVLKEDNLDASLNQQFDFYDSLVYSEAYQLKFHHLTHAYFSTLGVLFQDRDKRQDKTDREIMESYQLVSLYTLKFLDAFLKDDAAAHTFLKNAPDENNFNEGLLSVQSKKPMVRPFSFRDFNELAAKRNYENLLALYDSLLIKHPSMQFPEGNFNNLGLQLVFNPVTSKQGINVFLLATSLFPGSANLFDSLGEAYLFVGEKAKAVTNFEKSLVLYPENQNAIDRLKQLRK